MHLRAPFALSPQALSRSRLQLALDTGYSGYLSSSEAGIQGEAVAGVGLLVAGLLVAAAATADAAACAAATAASASHNLTHDPLQCRV